MTKKRLKELIYQRQQLAIAAEILELRHRQTLAWGLKKQIEQITKEIEELS